MDKLNGKQIKWKTRKGKEPFHSTLENGAHIPDIATLLPSHRVLQSDLTPPATPSSHCLSKRK